MTRFLVTCVLIAAAWPASAQWNVDVGGDPVTGGATSSMSSFDGAGNALLTLRCSAAGGSLRVLVTFPEGGEAAEDVRRAAEAEIRVDDGPQARFPLVVLSQVEGYVSLGRLLMAGRPDYDETVAALASARDRVGIRLGRRSYGFAAAGLQEGLEHLDRRCGLRLAGRPAPNPAAASPPREGAEPRPVIEPAAAPLPAPPAPVAKAPAREAAIREARVWEAPGPTPSAPAARGDAARDIEPEAAPPAAREAPSEAGSPAAEPAPRPVAAIAAAAPDPAPPAARRDPGPDRTAVDPPAPRRTADPAPAPQAAPTAPAPAEAGRPGEAGRVADAVARARAQIRLGNVAAARALLEHVEAAEDRDALFALAETFDPQALRRWGVVGTRPDPGRAAALYRRAAAQGQREAAERLAASAPARR
jgi:hypothetical protein